MADQKVKEMEPVETQIVEIMPPDIENLIYVVRNKMAKIDAFASKLAGRHFHHCAWLVAFTKSSQNN